MFDAAVKAHGPQHDRDQGYGVDPNGEGGPLLRRHHRDERAGHRPGGGGRAALRRRVRHGDRPLLGAVLLCSGLRGRAPAPSTRIWPSAAPLQEPGRHLRRGRGPDNGGRPLGRQPADEVHPGDWRPGAEVPGGPEHAQNSAAPAARAHHQAPSCLAAAVSAGVGPGKVVQVRSVGVPHALRGDIHRRSLLRQRAGRRRPPGAAARVRHDLEQHVLPLQDHDPGGVARPLRMGHGAEQPLGGLLHRVHPHHEPGPRQPRHGAGHGRRPAGREGRGLEQRADGRGGRALRPDGPQHDRSSGPGPRLLPGQVGVQRPPRRPLLPGGPGGVRHLPAHRARRPLRGPGRPRQRQAERHGGRGVPAAAAGL
mmetsp:Transcript_39284/g.117434  ORF Transcript_39284/g.117434 Transcript_39284/m.117434 type:complete len:366 (-) Transcript_39284:916-2013(-)